MASAAARVARAFSDALRPPLLLEAEGVLRPEALALSGVEEGVLRPDEGAAEAVGLDGVLNDEGAADFAAAGAVVFFCAGVLAVDVVRLAARDDAGAAALGAGAGGGDAGGVGRAVHFDELPAPPFAGASADGPLAAPEAEDVTLSCDPDFPGIATAAPALGVGSGTDDEAVGGVVEIGNPAPRAEGGDSEEGGERAASLLSLLSIFFCCCSKRPIRLATLPRGRSSGSGLQTVFPSTNARCRRIQSSTRFS